MPPGIDNCENCGRAIGKLETPMIHEEHVVCAECWQRLSPARNSSQPDGAISSAGLGTFACPSCGGENTQKLSVVYQSGSSEIRLTTVGSGIATSPTGFASALGTASTAGTQITNLAKLAAPPHIPPEPALMLMLDLLLGVGVFVWLSVADLDAALAIALGLGTPIFLFTLQLALKNKKWKANHEEYKHQKEEWGRKWLCHRCGAIFTR